MSELLEASRRVLNLWHDPQDLGTEVYTPAYDKLREAIAAEDQREAERTMLDSYYDDYRKLGGQMGRAAWERVWRVHMLFVNSDRVSPYEKELLL